MNESKPVPIEEGPHITQLMRNVLTIAVQKGADTMVLQPEEGCYTAIIQKGRGMELRRIKDLEGPLADSIIYCLGKAVDIRPAPVPLARQGRIMLRLGGKHWSIEVVSIPVFSPSVNGASGKRPIVALFFSECPADSV